MNIYVLQGRERLGPFTTEEINGQLARGELSASVLAWYEGSFEWVSLGRVPGVTVQGDRAPTMAASQAEGRSSEMPEIDSEPADIFYRNVADAFCRAVTLLFKPFDDLHADKPSSPKFDLNAFLNAFLEHATRFNDECPLAFATALRHSTLLDSVRGTTTKQLAAEVRSEAFEGLDEVLRNYRATMHGLNEELRQVTRQLNRIHGPEDQLYLIGLQAKGDIVLIRLRKVPRQHVKVYLDALTALPLPLIDYVSAKCFGGAVDLGKQSICTQTCIQHCNRLASKAVQTMEEISLRQEEEARKPQNKPQLPRVSFRLGCQGIFFLLLALAGLVILSTTLVEEPQQPPAGADAKEVAHIEKRSRIDMEQGIGWGLGLMAFGFGVPLIRLWETNRINRARGY